MRTVREPGGSGATVHSATHWPGSSALTCEEVRSAVPWLAFEVTVPVPLTATQPAGQRAYVLWAPVRSL